MSGPADYIARHRSADLASGVRNVVMELARISRMARMGRAPDTRDVWIARATQTTIANYTNLCREQVCRNLGRAVDLGVIERIGYTYVFLDVTEHDQTIDLCAHRQCQAEVRGRFRGHGRPRLITAPAQPIEAAPLVTAAADAAAATIGPIQRAVRRHAS